jgi:hypothetical protein
MALVARDILRPARMIYPPCLLIFFPINEDPSSSTWVAFHFTFLPLVSCSDRRIPSRTLVFHALARRASIVASKIVAYQSSRFILLSSPPDTYIFYTLNNLRSSQNNNWVFPPPSPFTFMSDFLHKSTPILPNASSDAPSARSTLP